jgi:phosphoglycolate phosphatase
MAGRLAIFDLDGTLVDSRADITEAVNRTLEELGEGAHSPAAIRDWIGEGVSRLLERALGHPERVAEARALFDRYYGEGLLEATRPYPGIDRLLHRLDGRLELAVATNKPGAMARTIVDGLGWRDLFGSVIGAREGAGLKPAPDMLHRLVERSGCPRATTTMVGDMAVDLLSARAAGVEFVGVGWGYGGRGELDAAGAPTVVDTADELLDVLTAPPEPRSAG